MATNHNVRRTGGTPSSGVCRRITSATRIPHAATLRRGVQYFISPPPDTSPVPPPPPQGGLLFPVQSGAPARPRPAPQTLFSARLYLTLRNQKAGGCRHARKIR